MLLPAVETRSGPFPGPEHRWTVDEASLTDGERFVRCLLLSRADDRDRTGNDRCRGANPCRGAFCRKSVYLDMLAAATGRPVSAVAGTGTSIGAALLTTKDNTRFARAGNPRMGQIGMAEYAVRWSASI